MTTGVASYGWRALQLPGAFNMMAKLLIVPFHAAISRRPMNEMEI